MSKLIRRIAAFLVISLLTLVSLRLYFHEGFPYTHDGENHLARFANYKVALKEGQIPPRFAPNLMNHYGYPVFNYNYPLANILSIPFSVLSINYEVTFKILIGLSIGLGLWGSYLWLSNLKLKNQSKFFALIAFVFNPYLINLVWFRGNIGEVMAMMLLPWLLYLLERPLAQNTSQKYQLFVSLVIAAFLLSHNVTAFFGVPLILVYLLIRFGAKKAVWWKLASVFFPAVLMTLWFWLPAAFEKNQVILDNASLSNDYLSHFVSLRQLIFSEIRFGFSIPGEVDSLSLQIGLVQISVLILGVTVALKQLMAIKKTDRGRMVTTTSLLSLLLFTFQLSFTQFLWKILPLSNFIQFPWRLSLFLVVFLIPLSGLVFEYSRQYVRLILILVSLIQIHLNWQVKAVDYFHKNIVDYDAFSQSTTTLNENLPKTFKYQDIYDWQPGPKIISGDGEIQVSYWSGSSHFYKLLANTDLTVIEPTMYFLGWETLVNGQKINYSNNEEVAGRISFDLSPGEYQIQTKFTQKTWSRLVGNYVSLFALVYVCGSLIYGIKKRSH